MNFIYTTQSKNCSTVKISINDKNITYITFFSLIKNDIPFLNLFVKYFKYISTKTKEYYLEFKPVKFSDIDNIEFEFCVIETSGFDIIGNPNIFEQYGVNQDSNDIKVFTNLSNTSVLISPAYNRLYPTRTYVHIGNFMRSNNDIQKNNLIKSSFSIYFLQLSQNPNNVLWLSTHGKNVAWLHVRIDQQPKYISYDNYINY